MARDFRTGRREHGFTMAELLVVLLIVGLIAAIAVPNIGGAMRRAEEAALRENLSVMRRAIDDHFADTARYPETLEALVERRYIRFVPEDPVAEDGASWAVTRAEDGGIVDLKSTSREVGLNDVPYDEW